MNRRCFLKKLSLLTLGGYFSVSNASGIASAESAPFFSNVEGVSNNKLILIELKGGNDGLNTLVPFKEPLYYKYRPSISLPEDKLIHLSDDVGMHPSLRGLEAIWQDKQMAWLQGVGYENPNRSHFRSIEIWETGSLDDNVIYEGWVNSLGLTTEILGIAVNSSLGPLYNENLKSIRLKNLKKFSAYNSSTGRISTKEANPSLAHLLDVQSSVQHLSSLLAKKLPKVTAPVFPFPKNDFGRDLSTIYTLIASGIDVPVYKATLPGFDTHVNQLKRHRKRLRQLSDGLLVLKKNLKHVGLWDSALIMTYSEFGRRLRENASKGTDHGAASSQFVLGGKVKGGMYGEYPSLSQLDDRGDIIYKLDFRDIYNEISTSWFNKNANVKQPIGFL